MGTTKIMTNIKINFWNKSLQIPQCPRLLMQLLMRSFKTLQALLLLIQRLTFSKWVAKTRHAKCLLWIIFPNSSSIFYAHHYNLIWRVEDKPRSTVTNKRKKREGPVIFIIWAQSSAYITHKKSFDYSWKKFNISFLEDGTWNLIIFRTDWRSH